MRCPICKSENTLHSFEYRMMIHPAPGIEIPITLDGFSCDHCEQETETPEITKSNDLKIAKAKLKWQTDHISETRDFGRLVKAVRESNNITQNKLTSLIGTTKNAISKYERGANSLSGIGERVVLLMAMYPETIPLLERVEKALSQRYGKFSSTYDVEVFESPVTVISSQVQPKVQDWLVLRSEIHSHATTEPHTSSGAEIWWTHGAESIENSLQGYTAQCVFLKGTVAINCGACTDGR